MNRNVINNCLDAIDKAKKLSKLNIFINDTFKTAIEDAERLKKNKNNLHLPLYGHLVTFKDNICTKTTFTTCGSRMLENYQSQFNATIVERILAAGAISLGKTNMDEFGMGSISSSYYGTVKNPWNLMQNFDIESDSNEFYISGGSSGGSAASVAGGIASLSIGTDTGGSIRHPAALCGCIGFKPTYGMISRYGLIPLNNYLDTVGIIGKDISTITEAFNVIAGPDLKDATTLKSNFKNLNINKEFEPSHLNIGIPKEFHPNGLDQVNLDAWNESLDMFSKEARSKLNVISLPNVSLSMGCYSVLTSCEIASNFSRFDGLRFGYHTILDLNKDKSLDYTFEEVIKRNRDESLGKIVKGRIACGNYFLLKNNYEKYFNQSQKIKQIISKDFQKVFKDLNIDLLVTPVCFHETPTFSKYHETGKIFDEKDFFTSCVNIAGLPAITVPFCLSKNLPVGVQFIANWGQEELLINVANWFIKTNQKNFPYNEQLF